MTWIRIQGAVTWMTIQKAVTWMTIQVNAMNTKKQASGATAPPSLFPHLSNQANGGGNEKDWWGSAFVAQGECQENTIPAKFAQIFEENFLQNLD